MEVAGRVRTRSAPDAEWMPLRENDVLRAGAEVQTGLRSHAALRAGANATIRLDAGTTLVVPELAQEGETLVTRAAVKSGRADIKVDRIGLENDFRVVTPSATIAVSGTTLAIQNGQLLGTEVTGSSANALAAIETRWMARRLAFFFGQGTSSARFNDPAIGGMYDSVKRRLMPNEVSDDAQLEQALVNGDLQNVIFNINDLQRIQNLPQIVLQDDLAIVSALALLLEIRDETAVLAGEAGGAAVLAASFAQKAVTLAAQAAAMIPEIECIVSTQSKIAQSMAKDAYFARLSAEKSADQAFESRDDALFHLAETIAAVKEENWVKAQEKADLASYAAAMANGAASSASYSASAASSAASKAAYAASQAQHAIDQYFSKVAEIDTCAAAAGAQAAIASNAAATAQSLLALAEQLAATIPGGQADSLLNQIQANVSATTEAAIQAAASRDQALAAASNARTMGEKVLFNWAAVYASQAAHDAAIAGEAAGAAATAALEAKAAADLAQELASGGGKGKGGGT